MYATYLYFYAALSFDALARRMHVKSTALEYTLDQAEECFLAADDALPLPCEDVSLNTNHIRTQLAGSHSRPSSRSSQPFHNTSLSLPRTNGAPKTPTRDVLLLNPTEPQSTSTGMGRSGFIGWILGLTSQHEADNTDNKGGVSAPHDPRLGKTKREVSKTTEQRQYEESLREFRVVLQRHIRMVQEERSSKLAKRDAEPKQTTASFAPYMHPGFRMNMEKGGWQKPKMSTDEKRERIRQGRERLWLRERFDAQKYQRLCEIALAEVEAAQKK